MLERSEHGIVGVPVLVVNAGGRAAVGYTANVAVHEDEPRPGLHIVDVFTEGLEFGLYTSEPEIEHFYLVFFLDSADSWLRSKHFIQRVEIAGPS